MSGIILGIIFAILSIWVVERAPRDSSTETMYSGLWAALMTLSAVSITAGLSNLIGGF